MSSNRDGDAASRHRLFHAMVLMGGSLAALRCGGEAATNGGGAGAGGAATGGLPATAGGSANPSSGGSANPTGGVGFGGGLVIPTGGQSTVDPGPFDCPPAQWNCAADVPVCRGEGFQLPEKCTCDTSRPLDPAACGPGQSLVCLEGLYDASGRRFTTPVPFACSCVQNQLNCGLACDAIFPNSGRCRQQDYDDTGLREILCDCAVIVLR